MMKLRNEECPECRSTFGLCWHPNSSGNKWCQDCGVVFTRRVYSGRLWDIVYNDHKSGKEPLNSESHFYLLGDLSSVEELTPEGRFSFG